MIFVITMSNENYAALMKTEAADLKGAIKNFCAKWHFSDEIQKELYDHRFGQNVLSYRLKEYKTRVNIQPLDYVFNIEEVL